MPGAARKAVQGFTTYEARRAGHYVKGKYGYDQGFLPKKTSPHRYPKPFPSVEKTAAAPKEQSDKPAGSTYSSQWSRDLSERRRQYMSDHLLRTAESIPRKLSDDKKKLLAGVAKREAILNAPLSELERLSFPSIDATIADEYPLVDNNKIARAQKRDSNRRKKDLVDKNDRLHQVLTLHHHSLHYVTTTEDLETLIEQQITDLEVNASPPKHTFPIKGTWNHSGRTKQIEDAVYDEILGTAAGANPGVLEVTQHLQRKESSGL